MSNLFSLMDYTEYILEKYSDRVIIDLTFASIGLMVASIMYNVMVLYYGVFECEPVSPAP